ncbi:unnamed protein product [Phytomonas sp. Hart1]|nr:unnamed protein product [Phytomonas sp. Hart1]|eukprot:CCW70190.1 unnamed protein product [Phytomonas sp. isolate Hart1]
MVGKQACAFIGGHQLKAATLPVPIEIKHSTLSHSELSEFSPRVISNMTSADEQNSRCPSEWQAIVFHQGYRCVLTFSEETDKLMLIEAPQHSNGKRKVFLDISMRTVLNIETSDERAVRELLCRGRRKAKALESSCWPKGETPSFLELGVKFTDLSFRPCIFLDHEYRLSQSASSWHSRKGHQRLENPQWASRDDYHARETKSPSGPLHHPSRDTQLVQRGECKGVWRDNGPRLTHYFVYYVSLGKAVAKKSVRMVEFCVLEEPHHLGWALKLKDAVLRRIYGDRPKIIEVFISPKSGKGDGAQVFRKSLRPILDVTRHTMKVTITKRAHECEDYVADITNSLDANYVVVVVGGDGMVQEVVNGLHRRRLALIAQMRAECEAAESVAPPGASSPRDGFTSGASRTKAGTDERVTSCVSSPPSASMRADEVQEESLASSLTPVFDIFLSCGWDALMPLVATIPSGSACGLAKALDLLDPQKAACSLVHHTTCQLSLLSMRFKRNPDLYDFHWKKWSKKKCATAKESFVSYRCNYSEEIKERLARSEPPETSQSPSASVMASEHSKANTSDLSDSHSQHCSGLVESGVNLAGSKAFVAFTPSSPKGGFSSFNPPKPFFKDGTPLYTSPVSQILGSPEFEERVAFMSLSFGFPNDVDRGSEPLRWMGNARFAVFAAFLLLSGVRKYKATMRYLPWTSNEGLRLENIDGAGSPTSLSHFPSCTMRDSCPHCQKYAESCPNGREMLEKFRSKALDPYCDFQRDSPTGGVSKACMDSSEGVEALPKTADGVPDPDILYCPTATSAQRRLLMSCSDADLLQEDHVDFDCESLPWVTVSGEFVGILLCNMCDLARDIAMAPFSHLSDGAIDIVFFRSNPQNPSKSSITRTDVYHFFNGLKDGTHIKHPYTSYIKARAIEIKTDSGICMSDGEMMPLSSVRLTKIHGAVRVIRSD